MNNLCAFCLLFGWLFDFMQLAAVHLVDAHLCSDPAKYVSALLLSLSTMIHMDLPHINVLSKIDLIQNYGKLGNGRSFLSSYSLIFFPFLFLHVTCKISDINDVDGCPL
jgi:hypothetical protein